MTSTSPQSSSLAVSRSPALHPAHVLRIHTNTVRPANAHQQRTRALDGSSSTTTSASTAIATSVSSTGTIRKDVDGDSEAEHRRSHSDGGATVELELAHERAMRAEARGNPGPGPRGSPARVMSLETVQSQRVLDHVAHSSHTRVQQQAQAWDPVSSRTASDKSSSWRSETLKSYHTPNAFKTRLFAVTGLYGQPQNRRVVVPQRAATFPPLLIGCIRAHRSRARRWGPAVAGTDYMSSNEGRVREANERYNRHYDRADPRHTRSNQQLADPTAQEPLGIDSADSESDPGFDDAADSGILKRRRLQKRHTVTFRNASGENNNGVRAAHGHHHLSTDANATDPNNKNNNNSVSKRRSARVRAQRHPMSTRK